MSGGREASARGHARSTGGRIVHAWRQLPPERRLAAAAALGLFVTLFLPWYQETVITTAPGSKLVLPSASLTGWAAFSFVEAAVLLVAVCVLLLLFFRAEGRAFHVPGGDGGVIFAAGLWTGALIVWRMFDKSSTTGHGQYVTTSGIEWGIFLALGIAGLLAYAGSRIKLAHEPEPPLPGEPASGRAGGPMRAGTTTPRRRVPSRPVPPRPVRAGGSPPRPREPEPPPRSERPAERARPEASARPRDDRLNFSDLDEIEFGDPPEAPTVRRRPPEPPTLSRGADEEPTLRQSSHEDPTVVQAGPEDPTVVDSEEQLTMPLDPPD